MLNAHLSKGHSRRKQAQWLIIAGLLLTIAAADVGLRRSVARSHAVDSEFDVERLRAELMAIPESGPMPEVPQPEAFTRMQQPLPQRWLDMERPPVCDLGQQWPWIGSMPDHPLYDQDERRR